MAMKLLGPYSVIVLYTGNSNSVFRFSGRYTEYPEAFVARYVEDTHAWYFFNDSKEFVCYSINDDRFYSYLLPLNLTMYGSFEVVANIEGLKFLVKLNKGRFVELGVVDLDLMSYVKVGDVRGSQISLLYQEVSDERSSD
ncbi:hypothetical protein [Cerasicoccus arenae]|uniref:Uncharacterized protein n=1 Tax=Cerasicoccus arenae TaxID=424488 RepID=A0A8J3DBF3_9BACT|nr:hypothetical protein [Cerasicoccus arenae]MBK1856686.1 hypothetical protein [Cerasicoccus arenae]GHB98903.1 hypothetical protein GCM10007047_13670 [Cerasicoccus arenae]